MKKILLVSLLAFGASAYTLACTNFLVGRKASADGSTFISYSADSYYLYGALYHRPASSYPEASMLDIHEWDSGKYLGQIKQVPKTYSVIGNMNEHQLAIGETTFGGRPELRDSTGIMDYGSLIYVTLQRARTAREAIRVMTDLVKEYGYYSSGESFSIADPYEVWILEMIGKGPGNKGAVWVALRMPEDCVSAHANQARITTIPFEDRENCMYSEDVVAFAREKGYFSGRNSEFSFSDVYNPLDFTALRACEARVWTFFRRVNPDMEKYISYVKGETKERMPLWIKPVDRLSPQNLRELMRDQYENTPLDITTGIGAGPFKSKLRHSPLVFTVDSVKYIHERPVATQQTGFSFIAQMRNWLPHYIGGVLWFGVDDAACSVYVPMYCGIDSIPWCYDESNGSLLEYSASSAFWVHNRVSNFAYSKYSFMMPDIQKVQQHWEMDFDLLVPATDKAAIALPEADARKLLTTFSMKQAENVTEAWRKLGEYLLVKYLDGNIKREKDGKFVQNEAKIPVDIIRPGYPTDFLRQLVKEKPDTRLLSDEEMKNRQ